MHRYRLSVPLPNLQVLRHYRRQWVQGDVVAGLTVTAYLVPQVMAYAGVAGLPPITGLWACLPTLALYALVGSSRQLSVGPESSTALLTASVVAPLAGGDPARYAALAAALAVVFGLLCALAWIARLGFVAELLSRPILTGYLAGLAAIMVVGQLGRITGVPTTGDTVLSELRSFGAHVDQIQPASVLVALVTLAFLLAVQRRWPRAPGPLIAVTLATLVVGAFALEKHGVTVVGPLTGGWPEVGLPRSSDFPQLILPAVGILVVGYTDNMLTARSFGPRDGGELDANQELLSLGVCNVGAGLFQGFPVSSSGSRTALASAAGVRTQLYSLVALGGVLITLAFLRPFLAHFPVAALGGLVVYAAIRLVDIAGFRRLARFRRNELMLAVAATIGVLAFNILYGVLIAIALSVIEMLWRVARPHDAILGQVPGVAGMHDVDDYPEAKQIPGLVVYRYDSPLFFANAQDFRRRALEAVEGHDGDVLWFVLNVEANVEVDITALDALESLRASLTQRGIVFALARVKHDLLTSLQATGLVAAIGPDRLYPTLPTALAAYDEWCRARAAGEAGSAARSDAPTGARPPAPTG